MNLSNNPPDGRAPQPGADADRLRAAVIRSAAAAARARALAEQSAAARARAAAVVEAGKAARREARVARDELNAAVRTYAAFLRTDGAPPERMLVAVKTAVGTGAGPMRLGSDLAAGGRTMMEDAVRWSIEAYFTG